LQLFPIGGEGVDDSILWLSFAQQKGFAKDDLEGFAKDDLEGDRNLRSLRCPTIDPLETP
jgi:hypothetical protein